jgi:hypothetical protein
MLDERRMTGRFVPAYSSHWLYDGSYRSQHTTLLIDDGHRHTA